MTILLRRLPAMALAIGLLCSASASAQSTDHQTTEDRLDTFVQQRMDDLDVPGVAYAVVGPQGIVQQGTLGEDGDGDAVTRSTPFLWGSVAKPVTATLVLRLVDDGVLRLDEPVVSYLPEFRLRDEDASKRITVRHLLAQTGGIPEDFSLTDRFDDGREPADVLADLGELDLEAEPGEEHIYSSVNYLVLAAVVEAATDRSFPDVLAEKILEPAGMDDAVTTPAQAGEHLPPGHRFILGRATPFDSPYAPAGAAYGYLGGTLEDAAAFAQSHLGSDDTLLDAGTRERMYRGEAATGEDMTYGLGWRRWPIDGTDARMIWHSGAVTGYFSSMIVLPDRDRAVVVLQNAYGPFHEDRLLGTGFGLVDLLYGKRPATSGTDPMYPAILSVLGTVCVALAGMAVLAIRRVVRPVTGVAPTGRAAAGLTAWAVALLTVMYAFAIALPGFYGMELEQLVLAVPDIAGLTYLAIGLAGVLLVLRVAVTTRRLRRSRRVGDPRDTPDEND